MKRKEWEGNKGKEKKLKRERKGMKSKEKEGK